MKKEKVQKNSLPLIGIAIISFAFFAVFGLSLITGNQQDSGVGSSLASAEEPADINSDAVVDIVDLSILLSNWSTTDSLSDINNDNVVDIVDLSILLSKWGSVAAPPTANTAYERGLAWYQQNTGVPSGTLLTASSGPLEVRTDGTVIDAITHSGEVYVYANNVVIRNSKIFGNIHINAGTNLLLDHIEMDGSNIPDRETYSAVTYGNYTLRNSRIHDYAQGAYMSDNTTVEDSWIYGLRSSGQHAEPIISMHGNNMSIRRNWLDSTWTNAMYYVSSALSLYAQDGPITNTIVDGNYLTGSGYLMYLGGRVGDLNNVQVTNNTFGVCDPAIECYGPLAPTIVDTETAAKWIDNLISNGQIVTAPPTY